MFERLRKESPPEIVKYLRSIGIDNPIFDMKFGMLCTKTNSTNIAKISMKIEALPLVSFLCDMYDYFNWKQTTQRALKIYKLKNKLHTFKN